MTHFRVEIGYPEVESVAASFVQSNEENSISLDSEASLGTMSSFSTLNSGMEMTAVNVETTGLCLMQRVTVDDRRRLIRRSQRRGFKPSYHTVHWVDFLHRYIPETL